MPLYVYRCHCGAESEHLARYEDREADRPCLVCGEPASYVIAPHHTQPDGIYSYAPNVGDPEKFDRKHEEAKRRSEAT